MDGVGDQVNLDGNHNCYANIFTNVINRLFYLGYNQGHSQRVSHGHGIGKSLVI